MEQVSRRPAEHGRCDSAVADRAERASRAVDHRAHPEYRPRADDARSTHGPLRRPAATWTGVLAGYGRSWSRRTDPLAPRRSGVTADRLPGRRHLDRGWYCRW